jgi:CheY-like chemotaxis protein
MRPIQRVLVVDDDDDLLQLCRASLRAVASWSVDVAQSGEAALALARDGAPDVILLDVRMPDNESLSILRRLKGSAATARIPVVLMTAEDERKLGDLRARGAAGLVAKPFDPYALPGQIARLVGSEVAP